MSYQAGGAPLDFTYYVTPQVTVKTSVFGPARNNAAVAIYSGSMLVWNATLMEQAPTARTPQLTLGDASIQAGCTFTLTIPTDMQQGNVVMQGTIGSGSNPPAPTSAFVANWMLTSQVPQQASV